MRHLRLVTKMSTNSRFWFCLRFILEKYLPDDFPFVFSILFCDKLLKCEIEKTVLKKKQVNVKVDFQKKKKPFAYVILY